MFTAKWWWLWVPVFLGTWQSQTLVDTNHQPVVLTFRADTTATVSSQGGAAGWWHADSTSNVLCVRFPRFSDHLNCGLWSPVNDSTAIWGGSVWSRVQSPSP